MLLRRTSWWIYILIFFITQLSAAALSFLVGKAVSPVNAMVMALFLANVLSILLFIPFHPKGVSWHNLLQGFRGRTGKRTLLMFLFTLPLIYLVNLCQEVFFPDLLDVVGEEAWSGVVSHPLGLVTVAFLGPIAEELLFRGGVQTDFSLLFSPRWRLAPIVLTAAIFSIIHMNPAQMPVAFILGFVLGFAYWWTGSLLAPILIHVFNNSFSCLMSWLSPEDDSIVQFVGGTTSAVVVAVVCVFCLIVLIRAMAKETQKSKENK